MKGWAVNQVSLEDKLKNLKKYIINHYPKAIGFASGIGSHFIIDPTLSITQEDYAPIITNMWYNYGILCSTAVGYLAYDLSDAYKNLKEVIIKTKIKKINVYTKIKTNKVRSGLDWILEHPKTTASAITSYIWGKPFLTHDIKDINFEYTEANIALVGFIAGTFGFSYLLTKLFNPILNSKGMKPKKEVLLGSMVYNLIKDYKKSKILFEKAVEKNNSPTNIGLLAEAHLNLGEFTKAMDVYGKMIKRINEKSYSDNVINNMGYLNGRIARIVIKKEEKLKSNGSIKDYLDVALGYYSFNNIDKSKETFERLIEKHKDEIELKCLYAYFLNDINKNEANQKWKEIIKDITKDNSLGYEIIGESKNKVLVIEETGILKNTFVFKESKDKKRLEEEINITREIYEITQSYPEYKVPISIDIITNKIEDKKKYVYAMIRESGKTLLELTKENKSEAFEQTKKITDYLALIHSQIPTITLQQINYREKLKRVLESVPQVNESLKNLIVDNIYPVTQTFDDAILVFNKDAHPQNWLITDNNDIVALDLENKGIIPIEFDLSNLIEYSDFFTNDKEGDEKRTEIIEVYKENYSKHSNNKEAKNNITEFRYLNSVIQRVISLYSAWSSLNRKSVWGNREIIVENALHSIDQLSIKHKDYFNTYNKNYNNLKLALTELESIAQSS